jgi:hypothetical protein
VFHDPQSTFGLVMLALTCVAVLCVAGKVALRPWDNFSVRPTQATLRAQHDQHQSDCYPMAAQELAWGLSNAVYWRKQSQVKPM